MTGDDQNQPARPDAAAGFVLPEGRGKPPPVLRKRRDFLACARARKAHMAGFTLQARARRAGESETDGVRVGYTCSKKVGNAVARNRAKRRLREAARAVIPMAGRPGWDYVLIGRAQSTAGLPFARLARDLARALDKVHGEAG